MKEDMNFKIYLAMAIVFIMNPISLNWISATLNATPELHYLLRAMLFWMKKGTNLCSFLHDKILRKAVN